MIAMFNDTIAKVADITYSQQIQILLNKMAADTTPEFKNLIVIAVSMVTAAGMFVFAYRKSGLV